MQHLPRGTPEGGLRVAESFVLVDRLVDMGIDYIHASPGNLLEDRPIEDGGGKTMIEQLLARIVGRGALRGGRTDPHPRSAGCGARAGPSMIAIGQVLVMDPDWAALAEGNHHRAVATTLDLSRAADLAIPAKMVTAIENTPGWFAISTTSTPANIDA